jgi:hypothetical protein
MTSVCVSDCGFVVDVDGKLALNLGDEPSACDLTKGEFVFCDTAGKLRVPDYGASFTVFTNSPGQVDTGYAATGGGDPNFRTLAEVTAALSNDTCRSYNVYVVGKTLGPQMKMTAGNSVQMAHAMTTDIDSAAPLPLNANFANIARLNPAFITTTASTDYLEEQYPPAINQRVIALAPGSTLYVRYRVGYKTLTFRSDSRNFVGVDYTELYLLGVS